MSNNHTNRLSDPFEDQYSPHTPIKNTLRSGIAQDGQGYMLSPPPAPKASHRAYRLSNDERRRQIISQIARKLTFDDHEDDEKKYCIRHARNTCHHRDNHSDRDDDGRPMNSIRFDGTYTFMDEEVESSTSKQTCTQKPSLASKMLGSPIRLHSAHDSPPQSSSSNSDTLHSSGSTLLDSPLSLEDDSKLGRKRARSIGEEGSDYMQSAPLSDSRNFRSTLATNPIDSPKDTQQDQSIYRTHIDSSSNLTLHRTLGESFHLAPQSSSNTSFIIQLQRTATHTGSNEAVQQSMPSIKQSQFFNQFHDHDPSSAMHRSVSNASYLIRTPNEFREAQTSKVVVAPRLKYNMAARSIHHPRQSRRHDRSSSVLGNSKPFNLNTPSLCAHFSNSNSPSPVISNTALPNVFSSQPMDYFGTWSAASSPLTQAH